MTLTVRPERDDDRHAVHDVTQRAFAPMSYAGGNEQDLINRFRDAGALAASLVAQYDGHVVGQLTLTPATAADSSAGWFAMGPVAVAPEMQGMGIGAALIRAGIDWLHDHAAAGCVLVGNPAYYSRFGFRRAPQLCPPGQPADYFQILPIGTAEPTSVVAFHPLFFSAELGAAAT